MPIASMKANDPSRIPSNPGNCQPLSPMKTTLLLLLALLLPLFPLALAAEEPVEELELLRQSKIATATPEVIGYLQLLLPSPQQQIEIAALIEQLSHPGFARRQTAFKSLARYGEATRELLTGAAKSADPEVRGRSRTLLQLLNSEEQKRLRQSLTRAALRVLKSRRDAQSLPVILATLETLTEAPARDSAAEALWASADPSHLETLTAALDHKNLHLRAAAVVALEVAGGPETAPRIAALLKSRDALIRLAAARALIDREPRRAVEALVALAAEDDQALAWQADALLQLKTGHRVELDADQTLGAAWKKWSAKELSTAKLDHRLGAQRLDLSAGRNTLEEDFGRDAASVAQGYGRFLYNADNGGPAKVAQGKLRIDGNHPEGDQRLYITSQRMIGRERWPDKLEVRVKLGGEAGNNFGWHMGVSVGNVKTLFHPGLAGGHFRAETTDKHFYLFRNEMMKFEPISDVMHEMIIRVTRTKKGADFDVTITGGKGVKEGKPHKKKFSVTSEQLGDYNRIGLERSGRTGADALFGSISIRLGR